MDILLDAIWRREGKRGLDVMLMQSEDDAKMMRNHADAAPSFLSLISSGAVFVSDCEERNDLMRMFLLLGCGQLGECLRHFCPIES